MIRKPWVHLIGTNTDWTALAGGWSQAWGVKSDGTLWSWTSRGPGTAPGSPRRFGRRSDWQAVWADAFGQTHVGLTADGQLWSWGTIIGLPPQQPTGLGPVVERTLSRVFKRPYGGGMSYPSTRDPWLIMRFETNAPATMSEGK